MKTQVKKYIALLAILIPFGANAQIWTYYKDYPVNVSPWIGDSDNMGSLYMLTSSREVWKKAGTAAWTKLPDFPVANFFDMAVNKNTVELIKL